MMPILLPHYVAKSVLFTHESFNSFYSSTLQLIRDTGIFLKCPWHMLELGRKFTQIQNNTGNLSIYTVDIGYSDIIVPWYESQSP